MPIAKPYYRIYRPPLPHGTFTSPDAERYLFDSRFAADRTDLIRGFHYLEQELEQFFEYVEPADQNLDCYSHRLYAMFLRASTEFETNAKAILTANGYKRKGNWDITDYQKVDKATRLSEYQVGIPWTGGVKVVEPFSEWRTAGPLRWYQDYNDVKHHRSAKFAVATLDNVLKAICGVFAIVFSQFQVHSFDPYRPVGMYQGGTGVYGHHNCSLHIAPANSWKLDDDYYDFDWPVLSQSPDPFQSFSF